MVTSDLGVVLVVGLALVAVLALYSVRVEPRRLESHYLDLSLPGSRSDLDGLVIAQLSDLHVGGQVRPDTLRAAIAACNAAKPDLVAITGDLFEGTRGLKECLDLLRTLETRPAFAILGNHDWKGGRRPAAQMARGLEALGITVLQNRAASAMVRGRRIWIVGVDDPCTHHDDAHLALSKLRERHRPRIFLTHLPDVADQLRPGDADLILAGHTHGGQIFVPLLSRLILARSRTHYSHGLYWPNGIPLYVSRGLGMTAIPARFLRRPEVVFLRLLRADRDAAHS